MTKPHQTASATEFNAFREAWIVDNIDIEKALAVPGVAELLLDEFHNKIIDAFDSEHADDDDNEPDGESNADYLRTRNAENGHRE